MVAHLNYTDTKKWLIAIRRDRWQPTKTSVVCGRHFTTDDYVTQTATGMSHVYILTY